MIETFFYYCYIIFRFFFFSYYNLKLIKTPIIILNDKSRLGYLYKLKFYQDYLEEVKLDYLAMKIIKQKKDAMAYCMQLELNLQKKKK